MNLAAAFFSSIALVANLSADVKEKKWIPIEPINLTEKRTADANKSKPQATNAIPQNLQVIKNLLDHVSKEGLNTKNKKNWYTLDDTE